MRKLKKVERKLVSAQRVALRAEKRREILSRVSDAIYEAEEVLDLDREAATAVNRLIRNGVE